MGNTMEILGIFHWTRNYRDVLGEIMMMHDGLISLIHVPWSIYMINGRIKQDPIDWRYVSTMCLAIFYGDIPLHRPEK